MANKNSVERSFKVFVRWRPLDVDATQIEHEDDEKNAVSSITLSQPSTTQRAKTWKGGASFSRVFSGKDINQDIYKQAVSPHLSHVLQGGTCNFFAYGHSGSGKTHTIIGYDFERDQQLGLALATAQDLFLDIDLMNVELNEDGNDSERLSLAVRLYEVRGQCAYDLLNNGSECHVREGPDGRTHIRGKTEMLAGGKVRVKPIVAMPCKSYHEVQQTVLKGLEMRKTGSSSVHDESSRTHAILELEIVSKALMEAREAVIERESELVPVGKRATDIYLEEQMTSLIKNEDGQYIQNPERPVNQARVDVAEAEKNLFESRVKNAEDTVSACFKDSRHKCLGGKFVFVDLAGSEYYDQGTSGGPKQTPAEKKQGRQINTDLFALKEVIRARAMKQARIPFRSSPLTMVLRSHFLATENAQNAMILTVSPAAEMYNATVNTLKYGNLVGMGGSG